MEDVITGQFLGTGDHLLATDDAHVVGGQQILRSSVWISRERPEDGGEKTSHNHPIQIRILLSIRAGRFGGKT